MGNSESDRQLRLVAWNVERSSISRFESQLGAINERAPDVIALQEVGVKVSRRPRQLLRRHGFEYSAHSHEFRLDEFGNSSGVAFASRWPFRVLPPDTFEMPAQHHALSAEFYTPFGMVEGHTVHVLPGSMVGETKVEMFEGIYDRLARENPPEYRFLCGDFNSPKAESADGEVTVWGSSERWQDAERSVITGLTEHDLADAYRAVNGYGDDAYSWVAKNQGNEWPRRFDHVFASDRLNATEASYLHEYDDLSDHTPLEVVFAPDGGRLEESDAIERRATNAGGVPAEESEDTTDESSPSTGGLAYNEDVRQVDPDDGYRRGRFKVGWNHAVEGVEMGSALDRLTWENLGWRLGKLFGETPDDLQEELYQWCVDQQTA
jgi:exonuclease III